MNQSLEVTNVKNEPIVSTLNDRIETSSKMQSTLIKQESNCLGQTEIHIKMEPQVDDNEIPVITSTSYETCHYDDMKFETEEPLIGIENKNLNNEMMQDPLDIGSEIKDEEQFSINLDQDEPGIKTVPTENEENLLEYDEEFDSHESKNLQAQLSIINDSDCKDKKFVCSECNKKFNKKSDFDRHLRIHTGEKPYTCYICGKSFNRKGNLDTHMFIHSGEKPHMCDICKKDFRGKSYLTKHKLIHNVGEKPFSCNECDKSFTHKQNLVTHQRIHRNEKPYSCDKCDKAFMDKSNLNQHRRLHTGEKPFSCDTCNKSFAQKPGLSQHKRIHKH